MSDAKEPLPPPIEPRRQSGTLLAAIVIAVVLMAIGCAGVCGGVLYFAAPRAQQAFRQANINVRVPGTPDPNFWMSTRMLSEVYTTSLAAVVEHKAVIEALGSPVMPNLEAAELYRDRTDPLGREGQHIEFDIVGPQGAATVAVAAADGRIDEIMIILGDGSKFAIMPLDPKPMVVR